MVTQGKWEYRKSSTGIRYIKDEANRELACVNSLEDGVDNKARNIEADDNACLIAAVKDLLEACEQAQFVYDYTICRTPTGPEREKLTERNILRMQAIAKATKTN